MTRSIYANGAVAKLSAPITPASLSVSVDSATNFPQPSVGYEGYWMTLVGSVSQAVEIVRVISRSGNVMSVERAQEGTTAQSFEVGDQAYHALTADDATLFRDAMRYYLGGKASEPTVGNSGEPLEAGMLYFNTTVGEMREYTGLVWQQFAAVISLGGLIESTWAAYPDTAAGEVISWTDVILSDNNNKSPFWSESLIFNVFIDGIKLLPITDFTYTENLSGLWTDITLINAHSGTAGAFKLSITYADSVVGGYIPKDDANASDWGALGTQADMNNGEVGKLAACDTAKTYTDAGDSVLRDDVDASQVRIDALTVSVDNIMTGFKNVLINPRMNINEVDHGGGNFDGNWSALTTGKFGYNRWAKSGTANSVRQKVGVGNMKGVEYTLQWFSPSGGLGIFGDGDGNTISSSTSGKITAVAVPSLHGAVITLPEDSINIQLELGSEATDLEVRGQELERILCSAYYVNMNSHTYHGAMLDSTGLFREMTLIFPVPLVQSPIVTKTLTRWAGAVLYESRIGFRISGNCDDSANTCLVSGLIFDAELYG